MLQEEWTVIERIELDIIIEQIRSLKAGIKKLDKAIAQESEKLKGYAAPILMRSGKGVGK